MSRSTLDYETLLRHGMVSHTIGTIPMQLKPAVVIWAKHQPRLDTLPLIALAQAATGESPIIYVDDTAARVCCDRTLDEQRQYNEQYRTFGRSLGCDIRFSSEAYEQHFNDDAIGALFELAQRTSISRFVRCLPEKKASIFDSLHASESMNMLLELLFFEQVAKECTVLVIRHFTQGIVLSHQKVAEQPLPALVVPVLDEDKDVYDYIQNIRDIYPDVTVQLPNARVS